LFITAYNTGMRAGELVNLKWNAVNFEQSIITVRIQLPLKQNLALRE